MTPAEPPTATRLARVAASLLVLLAAAALPGRAQEEEQRIPGVRLGLLYETASAPALTIRPLAARPGAARVAGRIEAILGRDLDYSDRFELVSTPRDLLSESGVDYQVWDRLGVVWLVTGTVESAGGARGASPPDSSGPGERPDSVAAAIASVAGDSAGADTTGYRLRIQLHDVVYEELTRVRSFPIPDPDSSGFRMAVHGVSDEIVEWVFGEPGMAASRIAFSRKVGDGGREIYVVDSDGENLRRVTSHASLSLSPAWSPDGGRIAYTSFREGDAGLYERVLATGDETTIPTPGGQTITPSYHPDGRELAFASSGDRGFDVFRYDVADGCCLRRLTGGAAIDMSPTYSPDGSRLAYMSDRLSQPHIYVTRVDDAGDAELVSPYLYGEPGYYTSPDWSPRNDRVAFHGRAEGQFQILVAEVEDRGMRVTQLTAEGRNEDPSWAPDGRHIVFVGTGRRDGPGLYVVDAVSGRIRPLLTGIDATVPDWSPTLRPPSRMAGR